MTNKGAQRPLGATDSGLRLSHYPVGSAQSRAAARALLESRRKAHGEDLRFTIRLVGNTVDPNRKCTCPTKDAGTFSVCRRFAMKPGRYALGSPCSRAAARSLLAARKRSEAAANLPSLAETIHAARMKIQTGEFPTSFLANGGSTESTREGSTDCLRDRITQARKRAGLAQGPQTMR